MSLEAALKDAEAADAAGKLVYQEIADKHGIDRSTLSRHHRGVTRTIQEKAIAQQLLTPPEELELVTYIDQLTVQHLPPTREMIANFASTIAKRDVSDDWVSGFLTRQSDALTSQWTSAMASDRHAADSYDKYSKYFDMLERKISEKNIEAAHTYNMDEKGFMIGVLGKSKRIFSKTQWKQKRFKQALMDGNREWITLIACVGASGKALPPGLIFSAESKNVQEAWVRDVDKKKHHVYVTTTASGWSDHDAGLGWLQQVFDVNTKHTARRKWRLLIVDGHGSHLSKAFLTYCHLNKILVAILPPHSTHTLQPLDAVLFRPLSAAYSKKLTQRFHSSKGLVPIKKGDFFSLFWDAWLMSFTEKLILKAFESTGIHPLNRDKILHRFKPATSEASHSPVTPPQQLEGTDYRQIIAQFDRVVKDKTLPEVKALRQTIHHLAIQNELLRDENYDLTEALQAKKKQNLKSKALDLNKHTLDDWGGAKWHSPRQFDEARTRERIIKEQQHADELEKANMRELKKADKLYKDKLAEEKRAKAAEDKRMRDERKAQERHDIDARNEQRRKDKEARDAQKAIQLSQRCKRKAEEAPARPKKKQRGGAAVRRSVVDAEPLRELRTHTTRSGRKATLYN